MWRPLTVVGIWGAVLVAAAAMLGAESGVKQSPGDPSTKRFFGLSRLTMIHYGPARAWPVGVSDITTRRFSNHGKRCCFALSASITGTNAACPGNGSR